MQPAQKAPPSSAFQRLLDAKSWPSLDGLRCLAVLPVLWHHATPRPLPGILGKGAVGVDLFFALSGFLITTLLLREKRRTGAVRLGAFYARRSLRIFPLYYAVLGAYALHAALLPASSATRAHFFESWAYHASYTANWLVDFSVTHPVMFAFSWSLCVEQQFYLVWPVLLTLIPRRSLLAAAMAAAIAVDAWAEHGGFASLLPPGAASLRVLTSFATPIGFGCLLGLLLDTPRGFGLAFRALGARAASPLLLVSCLALLLVPETPYLALSICLAALVGAVVVRPDHGLAWLLNQPALRYAGTLSYAAYLLHVSAFGLVRRALPSLRDEALGVFLLGLPVTLALAATAHYAIERPFLRRKARMRHD